MFRALKWAYAMGVRQERQRIKIEVEKLRQEINQEFARNDVFMRDEATPKRKREELEKQISIDHEIKMVLEKLTVPHGKWVESAGAPIDGSK